MQMYITSYGHIMQTAIPRKLFPNKFSKYYAQKLRIPYNPKFDGAAHRSHSMRVRLCYMNWQKHECAAAPSERSCLSAPCPSTTTSSTSSYDARRHEMHTHTLHALSIVSHLCNAHKHYRSKTTIFNKLHTQCTYALTHSNTHTTIYARACYTGAINYTCILSTYIMHVRYVRNYSTSHHREHLIIYIFRSRLTWLTSGHGDGIDGGGCTTALACDDSVTTPSRLVLRAQLRADVAHTGRQAIEL